MYQPNRQLSPDEQQKLKALAGQFSAEFLDGGRPAIENYLECLPAGRTQLLAALITLELRLRLQAAENPSLDEYRRRFPDDTSVIDEIEVDPQEQTVDQETVCTGSESYSHEDELDGLLPKKFGRYEVRERLGRGGFGIVFLAHDPSLNRPVALKVPRPSSLQTPEQVEHFVSEARVAAGLRHPGLVAVFDVQADNGQPFIVQEYIQGQHLGHWASEQRPGYREIATIFALIAEALGVAHQHGLTHCDLKLANVLMDPHGIPHVADFGLAIHESARMARQGERFGTPSTMAPEQVRGEGHRLDGRTDIWAVGVMLYQLLTGHRPFASNRQKELFDQIQSHDPKPPRQWNRTIPRELERICLKCLSKRRTDRYNTTDDLREDLLAWLESVAAKGDGLSGMEASDAPSGLMRDRSPSSSPSSSSTRPVKVIPKGLRSFDDDDADFFLELLPGPRDREGIPESIRFWKKRIEATDPEPTFAVGLIYGPSGCGKSSLLKAGLLPKLGEGVLPILIEATGIDTETRILKQIRTQVPQTESCQDLLDSCAALRRGIAGPAVKTLLVIDQFEQWLHANKDRENTELAQALRQADGERFQCIVLVRDDFWMSAVRFFRDLEVNLIEGHNLAAVDLSSERHARHVLAAFGRAFTALPQDPSDMSQEQAEFIERSVAELAENGKVVSVRLALFAEMMKNRAWTLESLRDVEGARGVGEAFMEETLSSRYASPEHRYHERAARSVLKVLLPEVGTHIRGHLRSHDELANASGYAAGSQEFAGLLRILDGELRLITPTDPEGLETDGGGMTNAKYYQLTHDYLVPSLRNWLTRKQRETREGRAQLRLAELSAAWNAKPESRNLPAFGEWLWILKYTPRRYRTTEQNRFLSRASRYHVRRTSAWTVAIACTLALLFFVTRYTSELTEQRRLDGLVAQIWTTELAHFPKLLERLDPYRDAWVGQVAMVASNESRDSDDRTRAHLALVSDLDHDLDYLIEVLLRASRLEHQLLLDMMRDRSSNLVPALADRLQRSELQPSERIRAASAIAVLGGDDQTLQEVAPKLVDSLVRSDAIEAARWCDTFVTIHPHLIEPLLLVFKNRTLPASHRYLVTSLITDIALVSPDCLSDHELAEIVTVASPDEYTNLLPAVRARSATMLPLFHEELDRQVSMETSDRNEQLLARQAIMAETLQRFGTKQDENRFLAILDQVTDPRLRTLLIGRLREIYGLDGLLERLKTETRPFVRQAIVLGLGEGGEPIVGEQRLAIVQELAMLFVSDPDSGVHAACEWVLRELGQDEMLTELLVQARDHASNERGWFISSEGQTMVQIDPPGEFVVGSPSWEPGRDDYEAERSVQINHPFAISAHEVTVRQFTRFAPSFPYPKTVCPYPDCPITSVSWSDAMDYCRWLTEQESGVDPGQGGGGRGGNRGAAAASSTSGSVDFEYSLPTVEEWEYATRAGSKTSRFFGNSPQPLAAFAWYSANADERTHRVGRLRPNPLGMFDVYGNAAEWCAGDLASGESPLPVRGGHYRATPKFLRSAMKVEYEGHSKVSLLGFRIVRRPVARSQNAKENID